MTTPAPFLTVDEFAALWRPMKGDAEKSWAELLLTAASAWIRDRKPDVPADDPAAKIVVTSAVKAALLPGDREGLKSWTRTVDDATTAEVLANPAGVLDFEEAGAFSLLRISMNPLPVGHFTPNDWGP